MFGQNPIVKQHLDESGRLRVKQVFPTIQGEGPHAGRTAVFVRLAGCNLRCYFCDTDFEGGYEIDVGPLVYQIKQASIKCSACLVVITGGEPLIQNIKPLVDVLLDVGFEVQIETAGTVWVPGLEGVDIVCSPKTAIINPEIDKRCLHFKYIIKAGEQHQGDGLPSYSTQTRDTPGRIYRPKNPEATIWVQAQDSYDPDINRANIKAAVDACLKFGYRLSYQIHKAIGVE